MVVFVMLVHLGMFSILIAQLVKGYDELFADQVLRLSASASPSKLNAQRSGVNAQGSTVRGQRSGVRGQGSRVRGQVTGGYGATRKATPA
eukprot:2978335-Rhodomonas_salina.1